MSKVSLPQSSSSIFQRFFKRFRIWKKHLEMMHKNHKTYLLFLLFSDKWPIFIAFLILRTVHWPYHSDRKWSWWNRSCFWYACIWRFFLFLAQISCVILFDQVPISRDILVFLDHARFKWSIKSIIRPKIDKSNYHGAMDIKIQQILDALYKGL